MTYWFGLSNLCTRTRYFKSLLFIHCIVAMTDIHSATTESQATIDDARARSRRSFIAILKVNGDVFSNLPERIEQWLEKETNATNQPETTEHRFVRPHWRMNRTLEYTVRISCLNCSHILKFKCHIVKYIRFGVDETTSSSDFFLLSRRGESDIARSDMEKRLECFQAEINANTQR